MAKSRKAMIVRLPAHVFDSLTKFSEVTGTTRNDFVVSLLVEALPQLVKLTEAAVEARKDPSGSVLRRISASLSASLSEAHKQVADAQFELGLKAAGAGSGRKATRPRR